MRCSPLQDNLRHLFLAGNPICLLPAYRERVLGGKACGPRLLVLDDLPVTVTERRSAAESLMAALAINVEQDEPSLVEARDAVHDEGEAHGEGDVKGEGRRLRVRGPLDVVHFGVKVRASYVVWWGDIPLISYLVCRQALYVKPSRSHAGALRCVSREGARTEDCRVTWSGLECKERASSFEMP